MLPERKMRQQFSDIYVSVGPLSGVEGPLMRNAFPVAAAGTVAGTATLHLGRHADPRTLRGMRGGVGSESEPAGMQGVRRLAYVVDQR